MTPHEKNFDQIWPLVKIIALNELGQGAGHNKSVKYRLISIAQAWARYKS